jgi:hypothetical protein
VADRDAPRAERSVTLLLLALLLFAPRLLLAAAPAGASPPASHANPHPSTAATAPATGPQARQRGATEPAPRSRARPQLLPPRATVPAPAQPAAGSAGSYSAGAVPRGARMSSFRLGPDVFASGALVELPAAVSGDAWVAAQTLRATDAVAGDLVALAEQAALAGDVGHTLYLIAAQGTLNGLIAGNARVLGFNVAATSRAHIMGGVTLAAHRLQFDGEANSYLAVVADEAVINGHVAGDLLFVGRHLQLGPQARIDGALRVNASSPPEIAAGAHIAGGTQQLQLPQAAFGYDTAALLRVAWWVWLLGWLLVAAVALGLWPMFTLSVSAALRARSGLCLLIGLTIAIITPIVAALLLLSVLGIPLGLLLILLYLLVLPLGYLSAVTAIGDWLLLHLRRAPLRSNVSALRLLTLTLMLVVLHLLGRVPVFGYVVQGVIMLVGIGALLLALGLHRSGPNGTLP